MHPLLLHGPEHYAPTQGVGLGLHDTGTAHHGSSTSTGGDSKRTKSRPWLKECDASTPTGRQLHGARQARAPRAGADDLVEFERRVLRAEAMEVITRGEPGHQKLKKSAVRMRRAYDMAVFEHRSGGFMGALQNFDDKAARSSRGKAAAEKISSGGGRVRVS